MKLSRYLLIVMSFMVIRYGVYAINNQQVIDQDVLDRRATLLTSINNIEDLRKLALDSYSINLTIKGDILNYKKLSLDQNQITLKDLLNYVGKYYQYKWYVINNQIIIDTLVNNKQLNNINKSWVVRLQDKDLRRLFKRWCSENGWSLIWNSRYDYGIDVAWQMNGSFKDAIDKILVASNIGEKKLSATIYEDNKVLVINSQ